MEKLLRSIALIIAMMVMLCLAGCVYTVEADSEERVALEWNERTITIQAPAQCIVDLEVKLEHVNGEIETVKKEISMEAGETRRLSIKELKTPDAEILSAQIIEQKGYNWWAIMLLVLGIGVAVSWSPDIAEWMKKKKQAKE